MLLTNDIKKLLISRSIHDSLCPLIQFCKTDYQFFVFLREIRKKFKLEECRHSFCTLAHLIRVHPSSEHEITFKPTLLQENFRKYINSWNRLSVKRIPFGKWADLAQEGIDLLELLINENKLEDFINDQRYRDFITRFVKRHEDLRMTGEYPDLNELMDD